MNYLLVKTIHQIAVVSTLGIFSVRACGSLLGAFWPKQRKARLLQHANDTVLLGSALTLAAIAGYNPLNSPWLLVKIVGLVVYIGLGTLVMREQALKGVRMGAFLLALMLFGFIVSVALSKSPAGIMGDWASNGFFSGLGAVH